MAIEIPTLPKLPITPWGGRFHVWQGKTHPFAGTHTVLPFTKPEKGRDLYLPAKLLPQMFIDWHMNKLRLDPAKPSQISRDIKAGEYTFSHLVDLEAFVYPGLAANELYRNPLGFFSWIDCADTSLSLEAIQGMPRYRIAPSVYWAQNLINPNIRKRLGHKAIYDWTQWLYVFALYQIAKESNELDKYKGIEGMVRMAEDSGASMLTYVYPIASHYGISGELGWFTINDPVSRIKALFEIIKQSMPVDEFIRRAKERMLALGSYYNLQLAYNTITGQSISTVTPRITQEIAADERPDNIPTAADTIIRTLDDLPGHYLYAAGLHNVSPRELIKAVIGKPREEAIRILIAFVNKAGEETRAMKAEIAAPQEHQIVITIRDLSPSIIYLAGRYGVVWEELQKAVIGKTREEARRIVSNLIRQARKQAKAKSEATIQSKESIIIKTLGNLPPMYMYRAGINHISLQELREAVLGRTLEEARRIILGLINKARTVIPQKTQIDIDLIKKATSEYYGIKFEDMTANTRSKEIATARQIAMYLARTMTSASLPKIGGEFGGRDHTTVMHACEKITGELKTNPDIEEAIRILMDLINKTKEETNAVKVETATPQEQRMVRTIRDIPSSILFAAGRYGVGWEELNKAVIGKTREEARRILIDLINKAKEETKTKKKETAAPQEHQIVRDLRDIPSSIIYKAGRYGVSSVELKKTVMGKTREEAITAAKKLINDSKTLSLKADATEKPAPVIIKKPELPSKPIEKPAEKPYSWEKEYQELLESAKQNNKRLDFTLRDFQRILEGKDPNQWPIISARFIRQLKRKKK